MANIFLVSDTHFGHSNILNFTDKAGNYLRPFSCVEEMDEHMISKWNSVVRPQDKVYHLGDVAMSKQHIATIGRCNGHKRLVRGNHDTHKIQLYLPYFEEIYATRLLDHMLLSHIPVHPWSVGKSVANIHGHVHNSVPALHFGTKYFNVSVEVIDYTPVSLEDLKIRVAKQQIEP
jgi:calcineurin-like phosphoesterase family protein